MNIYKQIRKQKGLTQVELSKILHVDQATISKWESGKTVPDQATLVQLSKFFNISIDSLLKNTESIAFFPTPTIETTLSENKKQLIEMIQQLSEDDTVIALGIIARLNNQPINDIIKKIN